jgi:hypothetical protein
LAGLDHKRQAAMSEYQYYEFLAIGRPLTSEEMAALRILSTRAHITPVSFSNEYHWGSFKGNPDRLMEQYFDAHIYVANWRTAIFMLRLPIESLAQETAKAMAVKYVLDFKANKTHWIITWSLEESENYDRFNGEDGRGWMARLAPIREELLNGDIRSLYVGWLAAVSGEMMDDAEMEPLAMSGLASLTLAQQALAEFLEIDPDLLTGAGMGNPAGQEDRISQQQMDAWIDDLPPAEVKKVLKHLLEGKGHEAEQSLKNRFAAVRRGMRNDGGESKQRTISELLVNAEMTGKIRLEKQKRKEKLREVERQKQHGAYLKKLSRDFPKEWNSIQQILEQGSASAYEEACRLLVDLSEAYKRHASKERFMEKLKEFMNDHLRRRALIQRLVKAGIWQGKGVS